VLKLRGSMTDHFGKWHVGQLSRTLVDSYLDLPAEPHRYAPPWESGFDKCFSGLQFPLFNPYYLTCGAYGSDDFTMVMNRPVARGQRTGGFVWISRLWRGPGQMVDEWLEGPLPEIIMDRTLDFIREARTVNRPFLASAWFFTPLHRCLPGQGTGRCTLQIDRRTALVRKYQRHGRTDRPVTPCFADQGPRRKHGRLVLFG
jgi:hypothetical protein